MGKILETLRHPGAGQPPRPETLKIAPVSAADEPAADEEMPFIEVGPRRSFEASAAVLATIPAPPTQPSAAPPPPPPSPPAPDAVLVQPHNVLFRSLTTPSRFAPNWWRFTLPVSRRAPLCRTPASGGRRGREQGGRGTVRPAVQRRADGHSRDHGPAQHRDHRRPQGLSRCGGGCKLRRPARRALGLSAAPGLTEVLAGECNLEEALRPTEQANLAALTAGSPAPTLASADALLNLLHDLRGQFDLVLVDGPRWDGRPGAVSLASICDAVFLVVPGSEADAPPASELVRTLPEQGLCLAGCILTGV